MLDTENHEGPFIPLDNQCLFKPDCHSLPLSLADESSLPGAPSLTMIQFTVARVCSALGMTILAYTAHPKPTPESRRDHGYIVPGTGDPEGTIPQEWFSGLDKASLHRFLSQKLDYLVISVPLTPDTTGFLGKEELEVLGHGFVSNVSRGKVVVQEELIEALKKGLEEDEKEEVEEVVVADEREDKNGIVVNEQESKGSKNDGRERDQKGWWEDDSKRKKKGLRGAALDVTDPEPLPEDSPLWTLPNVFVSPHVSGAGVDYVERAVGVLDLNLGRLERGERLVNVVDRKRGY